jgi:D-glycero-beta-D-manno-heptose 1-phosphate adenylyltransferase
MRSPLFVATGAFDIVHAGRVRFLAWAAARATPWWVGVEDDSRVAYWKGSGRPVNPAPDRAEVLAAFRPVSALFGSRATPLPIHSASTCSCYAR